MEENNYLDINRQTWNEKAAIHIDTPFYDQQSFLAGRNTLNAIELELLGDVTGKKILHLQCHFGQDTLSLSRMGADVTGIDFSEQAIALAEAAAKQLGLPARFICCDLYSLPQHLDEAFDIVFSSYGTIGWLPDIDRWADIVVRYLKPGGEFIFAEFHPAVWMMDNDLNTIQYSYFKQDPIIEDVEGTYADKEAATRFKTITWNHGLAQVIRPLMQRGLELLDFNEYDYSPYNVFPEAVEVSPSKFRPGHLGDKLPLVYRLHMRKK